MTENKEEIKRKEKVAVEDNAKVNTDITEKDDDDKNVDNVIMITEGLGKKPYTVEGVIKFIITSDDNGDTAVVGTLEAKYFIENTDDIYQIDTWRFCLNHVAVKTLECASDSEILVYHFSAGSFSIKA